MRGKVPVEKLLFDPEIERTARRNNNKTKKRKQLAKQRKEQEASSSTIFSNNQQETMAEEEEVVNNDTNIGFVNFTPRNMTRIGRVAGNDERPPEFSGESLCEAWERYKSMLKKCPNHGFDAKTQVHIFRNGLHQQSKLILDATAGGSLMAKTPTEAIQIIEAMALNDQQTQHHRGPPRKSGMLELGATDVVLAQNKQLQQQLDEVKQKLADLPKQLKEMTDSSSRRQVNRCDACTGDHPTNSCDQKEEDVNYLQNQQRQGQYQGNYPRGGNQQYNQPWKQDAGPSSNRAPYQNQQYQQNPQYQQPPPDCAAKLEDTLNQFMQMSMASIKNLEIQVGQMAKQLAENQKGKFTANTEPNPKEHC
ncbi:uncharacterized protein LOC130715476 [Lotus japonicus]|uniref:uncharacterized protein LOC130715476 n=1 Tax=Lotus japonicus TaxID=34305 RepID=UPI00258F34C8|nr:uncharacterized protein LOC130715476 [Lotus japonicus]